MVRVLTSAQVDALSGLRDARLACLMELQHPDGALRFSTLDFDWTDPEGVTWTGGAYVLRFGPSPQKAGLQGGALTVAWTPAQAALMAAALDGRVAGSVLTRWTVMIGPDLGRLGDQLQDFRGVCEHPAVDADPAEPVIVLTAEHELSLRLRRAPRFRYTPEDQHRFYPGDTGFDFVSGLQDAQPFND